MNQPQPNIPDNLAAMLKASAILSSLPEEKQKRVGNMVNALHLQLMQEEDITIRALSLEIMRQQSVAQMRAEIQEKKAGGQS